MGKQPTKNILALMKELSLYGMHHPLSNESRLSMRKKIWSLMVSTGLAAIWFTVNPNDINNPVKLKLAAHWGTKWRSSQDISREGQYISASEQTSRYTIPSVLLSSSFVRFLSSLSTMLLSDGLLCSEKLSHYYATVETNDRGAFHLHGLLWLHGNLELANLVQDLANPKEAEYREKVKRFVDDVFTETLNEATAKEAAGRGKKTTLQSPS